jgi:hypothetical protein
MPPTMKPGRRVVQPESSLMFHIRSSDSPTVASPPPNRMRTGIRADSLPAIGATTNETSESGRKRTPAQTAEWPSTLSR